MGKQVILLTYLFTYSLILLIVDAEGEMISFSGDEELLEALGHVTDGVLRAFVELDDVHSAIPAHHPQPHQLLGTLSDLLSGFGHCAAGPCGIAGSGCGKPGSDDSKGKRSDQEKEREKDQNEDTCHQGGQDFRRLFVDTANAFLEPLG